MAISESQVSKAIDEQLPIYIEGEQYIPRGYVPTASETPRVEMKGGKIYKMPELKEKGSLVWTTSSPPQIVATNKSTADRDAIYSEIYGQSKAEQYWTAEERARVDAIQATGVSSMEGTQFTVQHDYTDTKPKETFRKTIESIEPMQTPLQRIGNIGAGVAELNLTKVTENTANLLEWPAYHTQKLFMYPGVLSQHKDNLLVKGFIKPEIEKQQFAMGGTALLLAGPQFFTQDVPKMILTGDAGDFDPIASTKYSVSTFGPAYTVGGLAMMGLGLKSGLKGAGIKDIFDVKDVFPTTKGYNYVYSEPKITAFSKVTDVFTRKEPKGYTTTPLNEPMGTAVQMKEGVFYAGDVYAVTILNSLEFRSGRITRTFTQSIKDFNLEMPETSAGNIMLTSKGLENILSGKRFSLDYIQSRRGAGYSVSVKQIKANTETYYTTTPPRLENRWVELSLTKGAKVTGGTDSYSGVVVGGKVIKAFPVKEIPIVEDILKPSYQQPASKAMLPRSRLTDAYKDWSWKNFLDDLMKDKLKAEGKESPLIKLPSIADTGSVVSISEIKAATKPVVRKVSGPLSPPTSFASKMPAELLDIEFEFSVPSSAGKSLFPTVFDFDAGTSADYYTTVSRISAETSFITRTKPRIRMIDETSTSSLVSAMEGRKLGIIESVKYGPMEVENLGSIAKPDINIAEDVITTSRESSMSITKLIERTNLKLSYDEVPKDTTRFDFGRTVRGAGGFTIASSVSSFIKSSMDAAKGYIPFVKSGGEFKAVSGPLTKESALAIGGKVTGGTSAATFYLKEVLANDVKSFGSGFKPEQFYRRGEKYIEKPRYRINTPGELSEITFKGLRARMSKLSGVKINVKRLF